MKLLTLVLFVAISSGHARLVLPGAKEAGCGVDVCTSASLCPDMVGLSKAARLGELR